jgi:hypothetical protein
VKSASQQSSATDLTDTNKKERDTALAAERIPRTSALPRSGKRLQVRESFECKAFVCVYLGAGADPVEASADPGRRPGLAATRCLQHKSKHNLSPI